MECTTGNNGNSDLGLIVQVCGVFGTEIAALRHGLGGLKFILIGIQITRGDQVLT